MSIIKCSNTVKKYGSFNAIDDITFSIEENSITGLIGRNGAGKTTLLKMIGGFIKPTKGEVSVFGKKSFNNLFVSANRFYVDENISFSQSTNLAEILKTAEMFYPNWDMIFAKKLFDYFELNYKQTHLKLSKGMRSTFNMILALSARTSLTILDEPTTGMDSAVRNDFYKLMLKDYIANPRTMIISSHLLPEIEDILENILLINKGKLVEHKSIIDFKEMAIGLRGDVNVINDLTIGKKIYNKELFDNVIKVWVENSFSDNELQKAKSLGVEVSLVSSDDLSNYMTAKTNGGIDDVFNGN